MQIKIILWLRSAYSWTSAVGRMALEPASLIRHMCTLQPILVYAEKKTLELSTKQLGAAASLLP